MVGRIGAVAAQFVNGTLEKNVSLLLLVTSSCMIFGGTVVYFLPDDRSGHRLHDCPDAPDKVDMRAEILTPEQCLGEDTSINPVLEFNFSPPLAQTGQKQDGHITNIIPSSTSNAVRSINW